MHDRYLRIVVIDDEPAILMFAKTFLDMHMPDIVRVHTTTHIDWERVVDDWNDVVVVIVDIIMPISGINILQQIRDRYPHIKRIAWTAGSDIDYERVQKEKLAFLITKPKHEELSSHVLRILQE